MPWQRGAANVIWEIDPATGGLAYRTIVIGVPRQSGKTTLVLSGVNHRALGSPNQRILYGAQNGAAARKKWMDDWLPMLEHSKLAPFFHARKANGHEALLYVDGSIQGLLASGSDSGHGGVLDMGILDEAFAQKDARAEQAVVPAMNTRPWPQWWVISTAGTPKDSPYLYAKVLAGRKLVERQIADPELRRGTCYIEYSAPEDADPFDRSVWWGCMPALGYTITEDAVVAAMDTMLADPKLGLNEFRRAYLNQWVLAMGDPILPLDAWRDLGREDAARPPWVVLGISVAPEDAQASVVACGEDLIGLQSTVVEQGEGIDWLLDPEHVESGALARLVEKYDRPYVIVSEKECGHLLPEIERVAGFDRVKRLKPSEMVTASAFWLRLCKQHRLLHRDEPELTVALAGAERRKLNQGWSFNQEKSGCDITPLQAQVLASSFWLGAWGDDDG